MRVLLFLLPKAARSARGRLRYCPSCSPGSSQPAEFDHLPTLQKTHDLPDDQKPWCSAC